MRAWVAIVLAVLVAGCGGESPEPPPREPSAPGADLAVEVQVRADRDGLWRERAKVAPGDRVFVRLQLANTGGAQADGIRTGVVLPEGLTARIASAARFKVGGSAATGAPIQGRRFVGGDLPIAPLQPGDEATYRLTARADRDAAGALEVRGVARGEGGAVRDGATIRVRR